MIFSTCTPAKRLCVALLSAKGTITNRNDLYSPFLIVRLQQWLQAQRCSFQAIARRWLCCIPGVCQSCGQRCGLSPCSTLPGAWLWAPSRVSGQATARSVPCRLAKPPLSDVNAQFLPETELRLFGPAAWQRLGRTISLQSAVVRDGKKGWGPSGMLWLNNVLTAPSLSWSVCKAQAVEVFRGIWLPAYPVLYWINRDFSSLPLEQALFKNVKYWQRYEKLPL